MVERELEDELRFHLDQLVEENIAAGMPPGDARMSAIQKIGGIAQLQEECRDMRRTQIIDQSLQDANYAFRSSLKNPTISIVIVASLALGIGANTAIFSLINTIIMRPLPGVSTAGSLVRLTNGSFTFPQFEALRTQQLFGDTVAISDDRFQVEIAGSARIANGALASGEYFTSLGVNAAIGRTISADDERTQAPVAVLDHAFWQRVFSSNPKIIGQTLRVNGVAVTVIGITPQEFKGVVVGRPADFTLPITLYPLLRPERSGILTRRSAYWLNIMARLQPNQTLDHANARLKVVWPQVLTATAPPDTPSNSNYFHEKTDLEPAGNGFSPLRRVYTSPLYM
jgi:hypothetical protein